MSVLALERLTYAYPGAATPALDDVTLRVEEGELIVLAGRSGSGKSTLLRLASGLVPHVHGGERVGIARTSAGWTCATTAPASWPPSPARCSRTPRRRS